MRDLKTMVMENDFQNIAQWLKNYFKDNKLIKTLISSGKDISLIPSNTIYEISIYGLFTLEIIGRGERVEFYLENKMNEWTRLMTYKPSDYTLEQFVLEYEELLSTLKKIPVKVLAYGESILEMRHDLLVLFDTLKLHKELSKSYECSIDFENEHINVKDTGLGIKLYQPMITQKEITFSKKRAVICIPWKSAVLTTDFVGELFKDGFVYELLKSYQLKKIFTSL